MLHLCTTSCTLLIVSCPVLLQSLQCSQKSFQTVSVALTRLVESSRPVFFVPQILIGTFWVFGLKENAVSFPSFHRSASVLNSSTVIFFSLLLIHLAFLGPPLPSAQRGAPTRGSEEGGEGTRGEKGGGGGPTGSEKMAIDLGTPGAVASSRRLSLPLYIYIYIWKPEFWKIESKAIWKIS